jgi:hypothetical protein
VINNSSDLLFVAAGDESEYKNILIPVVGMALPDYKKLTKYGI